MRRNTHLALMLAVALAAAPAISHAESVGESRDKVAALGADRQKLRAELDRVNSEIDTLKRETRGLRDDYRLRARMADAEALARRLTEMDARLGINNRGSIRGPNAVWPTVPQATPSDDPADLEAKADILSDQSRRLSDQAEVLTRRVDDLHGRQELRRRAGQLERDPFLPLEQVKRRIASAPSAAGSNVSSGNKGTATDLAVPTVAPGTPSAGSPSTGSPPPTQGSGTGSNTMTGPAPTGGGAATTGGSVATTAPQPTRVGDSTGVSAAAISTGVSTVTPVRTPIGSAPDVDGPSSIASQYGRILDATTLAEIRRLEAPGSPSGNLQAMEHALSVLRTRARELEAAALSLRKRARTTR